MSQYRTTASPIKPPLRRPQRPVTLSAAAALMLASGAAATDYVIPTDFPTIQDGINNASSGDTITVDPGIYPGAKNVNLDTKGKDLTIIGSALGTPVIDCAGVADGIWIKGGTVSFSNFKIINSVTYGIKISSPIKATVTDCDVLAVKISGGKSYFYTTDIGPGGLDANGAVLELYQSSVNDNVGRGITAFAGTLKAVDCDIKRNKGPNGGGIRLQAVTATLTNCTIAENEDQGAAHAGGGLVLLNSTVTLDKCTILSNVAGVGQPGRGGGIYIDPSSKATLIGTLIEDNTAGDIGGVSHGGGGVFAEGAATYAGCTFRNNHAASNGPGILAVMGKQTFTDSLFENHTGFDGGAAAIIQSPFATFTGCRFENNQSLDDGTFAGTSGGAVFVTVPATFERCWFRDNANEGLKAGQGGGEVYGTVGTVFDNCIFSGNTDIGTGQGGALNITSSDSVINCTFYGNSAALGKAGALHDRGGSAKVVSSIFWSNGATPIVGATGVTYSDVEFGHLGTGNVNADPKFVDAAADDFRLLHGSKALDAGDNSAIPVGVTKDYGSNPRRHDDWFSADTGFGSSPVVDMGAHEIPVIPVVSMPANTNYGSNQGGGFGGGLGFFGYWIYDDACKCWIEVTPGDPNQNGGTVHITLGIGKKQNDDGQGELKVVIKDEQDDWASEALLVSPDGKPDDLFAAGFDSDGQRIAVSAPRNDDMGSNAGAAYIFRREGDQWAFEAKVYSPEPSAGAQFGYSIAIRGDLLLTGSWRADPDGVNNAGVVYAFRLIGEQWQPEATLIASDPSPDAEFGRAMGFHSDALVIGAPGAYGDTGRAYIFRQADGLWFEEAALDAPQAVAGDRFGAAVALWGGRALIGAPGRLTDSGGAFLFHGEFGEWTQEADLTGELPPVGALAGLAVAIEGESAAVGAPGANQVALFSRGLDRQWAQDALVTDNEAAPGDAFGRAAAVRHGLLVVGAPGRDGPNGADEGAVYTYGLQAKPCYADFTGDGVLDLFDFLGYVNTFNAGGPDADCTADANLDLFDFLCFMNAFNQGC